MSDQEIFEARLELVDFVIEVFYDTPDVAFIERLLDGDVELPDDSINDDLDTGFDLFREFLAANEGRDPAEVADELGQEYSRLFAAPRPPVLPHETYFRDDTDFMADGLANVTASYSAAGWEPSEEYPEEDDFIAVELAFLRTLISRQRAGQEEAFGFERVFLDEHLLTWSDDLLDAIVEQTDETYFLAAAYAFVGLLEFEDELVAQMVAG